MPRTETQTPAETGLGAPHRPRPIRFLRRQDLGDWRLKLYSITLPGKEPRPELVDAVLDLAPDVFPQPAVDESRYGTGFVTIHDSATFGIALYYWWQSENELHQRIYLSPLDDPTALKKMADPAAGCVWELQVVDFESRAWLADVLANPDGPDVELYLTRRFDADI
ncbi:MAG: isochorismatase [Gaiellaceae bacterium]